MKKLLLLPFILLLAVGCAEDDDSNNTTPSNPPLPDLHFKEDTVAHILKTYVSDIKFPPTSIDNKKVLYNFQKDIINGTEKHLLSITAKGKELPALALPFFKNSDVILMTEYERFIKDIKSVCSDNQLEECRNIHEQFTNQDLYVCSFQCQDTKYKNIIQILIHKYKEQSKELTHIVIENEYDSMRNKPVKLPSILNKQ